MTNPIKLTDEVLERVANVLRKVPRMDQDTEQFIAAIRTLRDRARAVVGSSGEPFLNRIGKRIAVDAEYLNALREVLP